VSFKLVYILTPVLFAATQLCAQFPKTQSDVTDFRGRISGGGLSTYNGLIIEITNISDYAYPFHADVAPDGSFAVGDIPIGDYNVRVTTLSGGELASESTFIGRMSPYHEIRLPESKAQRPTAGTVSIQQLMHPPSKQVRKLLDSGNRLLDSSHNDDAAARFREALKEDPDCPQAHAGLALALTRAGSYDEAAREYRAAVAIDPGNSTLHNNLGGVLALMKQFAAAQDEARTALKLDPRNVRAHMIMAAILLQSPGQEEEAMPHLVAARDAFPSAKSAVEKICSEHPVRGCP
jgi:Flp pilus assembly protein TadD